MAEEVIDESIKARHEKMILEASKIELNVSISMPLDYLLAAVATLSESTGTALSGQANELAIQLVKIVKDLPEDQKEKIFDFELLLKVCEGFAGQAAKNIQDGN